MVNPELPDDDYPYYLDYTRARALVCDAQLYARIKPAIEKARCLKAVVVVDGEGPDTWSAVLAAAPATPILFDTSKDDPAIWLFTSGSTGKPKAAVHLHHDFAWNTERYAKEVLEISGADRTLSVPKLYFGYATGNNLMFPFAVGATTILFAGKPTPERLFELCLQHNATLLTSVPTMINKMTQHPDAPAQLSLRVCTSAGEALPEELYRRWIEKFGVEILDGIGSAELFHVYISNRIGRVKPGSLGQLVRGYEARVVGGRRTRCSRW